MRRSEADRLASSRHRRRLSRVDFPRLRGLLAAPAAPLGQRKFGAAAGEESASMIRPLHSSHRIIFCPLGIALPVLFMLGLLARHAPLSSVQAVEGELAQ